MSLLFNQTCLNERLLPNYTHTYTYIYIYIYIEMIDCDESDYMIEICGKLDKSNT